MILEPDYYQLSVEKGFSPLNHDLGTGWEPWNLYEDGEGPYCAPGCDYAITGYHAKRGGRVLCDTPATAWVDGEGMEGSVEVTPEEEADE